MVGTDKTQVATGNASTSNAVLSHGAPVTIIVAATANISATIASVTVGGTNATQLAGALQQASGITHDVWYYYTETSANDSVVVNWHKQVIHAWNAASMWSSAIVEAFFESTSSAVGTGGRTTDFAIVGVAAGTTDRRVFQTAGTASNLSKASTNVGLGASQTALTSAVIQASLATVVTAISYVDTANAQNLSAQFTWPTGGAPNFAWATAGTGMKPFPPPPPTTRIF